MDCLNFMLANIAKVVEIKASKTEVLPAAGEEPFVEGQDLTVTYLPAKKIRRIRECSDLRAWWDKEEEEPEECA